jgi:hypothetical protein
MCDGCSLQKNREEWAKYPDMMDLCKMCNSFQEAIRQTIEEVQAMQNKLEKSNDK